MVHLFIDVDNSVSGCVFLLLPIATHIHQHNKGWSSSEQRLLVHVHVGPKGIPVLNGFGYYVC